jgi:hypothetical protein
LLTQNGRTSTGALLALTLTGALPAHWSRGYDTFSPRSGAGRAVASFAELGVVPTGMSVSFQGASKASSPQADSLDFRPLGNAYVMRALSGGGSKALLAAGGSALQVHSVDEEPLAIHGIAPGGSNAPARQRALADLESWLNAWCSGDGQAFRLTITLRSTVPPRDQRYDERTLSSITFFDPTSWDPVGRSGFVDLTVVGPKPLGP